MRVVIEVRPVRILSVAADLVADKHRLVKHHPVDRDRDRSAAPARSLRREIAASEIHLRQQPAAEDVTVWVGVGRHAMTLINGAAAGERVRRSLLYPIGG